MGLGLGKKEERLFHVKTSICSSFLSCYVSYDRQEITCRTRDNFNFEVWREWAACQHSSIFVLSFYLRVGCSALHSHVPHGTIRSDF